MASEIKLAFIYHVVRHELLIVINKPDFSAEFDNRKYGLCHRSDQMPKRLWDSMLKYHASKQGNDEWWEDNGLFATPQAHHYSISIAKAQMSFIMHYFHQFRPLQL